MTWLKEVNKEHGFKSSNYLVLVASFARVKP